MVPSSWQRACLCSHARERARASCRTRTGRSARARVSFGWHTQRGWHPIPARLQLSPCGGAAHAQRRGALAGGGLARPGALGAGAHAAAAAAHATCVDERAPATHVRGGGPGVVGTVKCRRARHEKRYGRYNDISPLGGGGVGVDGSCGARGDLPIPHAIPQTTDPSDDPE